MAARSADALIRDRVARLGALGLGIGLIGFTAPLLFAPRAMARLGGITVPDESAATLMRGVAMRDLALGIALIEAARRDGRLAPWLIVRLLSDAGDALWVAIALLRGGGNPRLAALGGVALGATVVDAALYALSRTGQRRGETT